MGLMDARSFFGTDTVDGYNAVMKNQDPTEKVGLGTILGAIGGSANKSFIQPPIEALKFLSSPEAQQFDAQGMPANPNKFTQSALDLGLGMTGINIGKNVAQKGVGGLMVDPNELSIFAGQAAKNADNAALALAKEMTDQGIPQEKIWRDTGWGKAKDGKWRFEIDDSKYQVASDPDIRRGWGVTHKDASGSYADRLLEYDGLIEEGFSPMKASKLTKIIKTVDGEIVDNMAKEAQAEKVINHPTLGDEYDMGNISVTDNFRKGNIGGSYNPRNDEIEMYSTYYNEGKPYRDVDEFKSNTLHELQHATQQREGFAEGGGTTPFKEEALGVKRRAEQEIEQINGQLQSAYKIMNRLRDEGQPRERWQPYADDYYSLMDRREDLVDSSNIDVDKQAFEQYERLLGETEARTVQDRMNLTPEQRREQFPEYLGRDDLIVRDGGGLMQSVSPADKQANFDNWFGNSKVVDADGKPLTVYHGTDAGFDVFDKKKRGSSTDAGIFGKGFYFSNNDKTAKGYGDNIKPANLLIKKPFRPNNFASKAEMANYLGVDESILRQGGTGISALQPYTGVFSDAIKSKGHDGVITRFGEHVVFEPEQIKSTSNRGTYNPNDPNILRSEFAPVGLMSNREDDQ